MAKRTDVLHRYQDETWGYEAEVGAARRYAAMACVRLEAFPIRNLEMAKGKGTLA